MRIGCNTLYSDTEVRKAPGWCFEPHFIVEALQRLKEIGYTHVEFSHIAHLSLKEAESIGGATAHIGLKSWSCHSTFTPMNVESEQAIRESADQHIACADICAAIGGSVLVVHPTGAPTENGSDEEHQRIFGIHRQILERVCEHARQRQITIALENGGSFAQMEYIVQLTEALDCGICVDTGHANLGNLGAARAIRMAGKRLATTHLQDNWGKMDDHRPPGTGMIDWFDVFHALKEVSYEGVLMLELTDSPPASREYDQEIELQLGLRNVRAFAMAAGLK